MYKYILLFCCFAIGATAQKPSALDTFLDGSPYIAVDTFVKTITPEDIGAHLAILAADDMEGRETGTAGCKKAADYIAKHFESLGLPKIGENDTYFQTISFLSEYWESTIVANGDESFKPLQDFYALPWLNPDSFIDSLDEVIFLGYGIDEVKYSDYYNGPNLKGKTILIFGGEPMDGSDSWITQSTKTSKWSDDIRTKLVTAKKAGVKNVLIVDPMIKKNISTYRNRILNTQAIMGDPEGQLYPNNLFISSNMAKNILGRKWKKVAKARKSIQKKGKPKYVEVETATTVNLKKNTSLLKSQNVLGYVQGVDPKLKDELIVVSAHYDHLGKKGNSIFNGADDNGSGTSTLLDVAEAIVLAKRGGKGTKRSVLFMLLSGEEKGLLGSEYYVNHPIFPLEKTVANVNIDMIGRTDKAHKNDSNYVYVIGADKLSSELHYINENANKRYANLALDYTFNDENDPNRFYYRSDHYNFAKNGIPAVFFFSGVHKDYHRPEDDVEKIILPKVAKIGKLAFGTLWELSNRTKRIEVDKK